MVQADNPVWVYASAKMPGKCQQIRLSREYQVITLFREILPRVDSRTYPQQYMQLYKN